MAQSWTRSSLVPAAVLAVACIAIAQESDSVTTAIAVLFAVFALMNYSFFARWLHSRSWPRVHAKVSIERSNPSVVNFDAGRSHSTHNLHLEYDFEGKRYFRTAQASHYPEGHVGIRVNPSQPSDTFLELTSPVFNLAIFGFAIAGFIAIPIDSLAA